ncbi:MAG: hypothetical protein AAF439_04595 [Pseudomonadota bacterium]
MTTFLLLAALAISLVGVVQLTFTNPRRRRILGQDIKEEGRSVLRSRILVWAPGIALIVLGETAGVVMWFAGLTTIGWAIVSAPLTTGRIFADVTDRVRAALQWRPRIQIEWLSFLPNSALRDAYQERFDAQERRIAELEARLATFEAQLPQPQDRIRARPEVVSITEQPPAKSVM